MTIALVALVACGQHQSDPPARSTGAPNDPESLDNALVMGSKNAPSATNHRVPVRRSLAAGRYALSSSTPFLPFAGNRGVLVPPLATDLTTLASALLRRNADCSLTESIFEPTSTGFDITNAVDLPGAQTRFHQLSGLSTTPNVFPQGCVDTAVGRRSVSTALPVSLTASTLVFADINPNSEQLEVRTVNRATNVRTTLTLTSGRAASFMVIDIDGDGLNDIVGIGAGFGGGTTGNLVVFMNNGDGTFRTTTNTPSGGSFFTVADLDHDGKLDLVIDNGFDGNGVAIPGFTTMLGNGNGTFRAGVVTATAIAQASGPFVVGDFNGDGKPDILLNTRVALGVGDGTFTAGPALPASVQQDLSNNAAVGDLDHDGRLDVAYTSNIGAIQILRGNGDGSFTIGPRYLSIVPSQPIAITEIDGDGNLDVFVGNYGGGVFAPEAPDPLIQRFQVLLGRGDGTLAGAPIVRAGLTTNLATSQVGVADLDGDGRVDVLVVDDAATGGINFLPGDGAGGLGAAVRSAIHVNGQMLVAVDMNGDGKADAVVAGQSAIDASPLLAVVTNQGGGHFAAEHDYALPNYPMSIVTGDFDGDGRVDVAIGVSSVLFGGTATGVYVLYGQSDGTLGTPQLVDGSILRPVALAAADLNGDGRTDLLAVDAGTLSTSGGVHLYLGNANRTFATGTLPATSATQFGAVAIGDMNGDGKRDLVVSGSVPGTGFGVTTPNLYTYLGNGDGTFAAPHVEPLLGTDGNASAVAIADFDHDGHADVVVGIQNDFTEVLLGNGDGTYAHALLAFGQQPETIAVVDLDNDLFPDLLIGFGGNALAVLKNAGTVAAWVRPTSPTGTSAPPPPAATGDFALTATPATAAVVAGQSAQTIVAVTPSPDFNQTVTLACTSGLPTGASCAFTPPTLTPSGGAAASSSLTITTRAASAIAHASSGSGGSAPDSGGGAPVRVLVATLIGGTMLLFAAPRRKRVARRLATVGLIGVLASCGGDGGGDNGATTTAPPATGTTFNVTITATGASTSHTATFALTVH